MRKIQCTKCKKYKEFKKPEISCIYDKKLLLSGICKSVAGEDEEIFEKRESIEILKIIGLIENI